MELQMVLRPGAAVQDAVRHKLADEQPQVIAPWQLLLIRKLLYCVPRSPNGRGPATKLDSRQENPCLRLE
jgi:hypothetical protein